MNGLRAFDANSRTTTLRRSLTRLITFVACVPLLLTVAFPLPTGKQGRTGEQAQEDSGRGHWSPVSINR